MSSQFEVRALHEFLLECLIHLENSLLRLLKALCFSRILSWLGLGSEESFFSSLLVALTWPLRLLSSGVHQLGGSFLVVCTFWGQTLSRAFVISFVSFSASNSSVCFDQNFGGFSQFCSASKCLKYVQLAFLKTQDLN